MIQVKAKSDVFVPLTKKRFEHEIKKGEENLNIHSYATSISFEKESRSFILCLSNNTEISFNIDEYEEFKNIPFEDLSLVRIGFAGTAICLDKHDLHIYIPGLISSIKNTNTL